MKTCNRKYSFAASSHCEVRIKL